MTPDDEQTRINFDKAMQKLGEQSEALLKEAGLYDNFIAWQVEHGVEAKTAQPNNTIDSEVDKYRIVNNDGSIYYHLPDYILYNLIAQEANKAQLDVIDRLARELEAEQSIEVNKDDTGLNYYYTIKSVEWAIERIRNQLTAEKGKA